MIEQRTTLILVDPPVPPALHVAVPRAFQHGIALQHKVVAGKHVVWPTEETVRAAVSDGYGYIALGTDIQHVVAGAKNVEAIAKKALG